jgi:Tyrosine phosphatase family
MSATRQPNRFAAAFLSLAFVVAAPTSPEPRQSSNLAPAPVTTEHSFARKLTLAGVPDFGEITPTLYRGSQPSKEGLHNLADMGIAMVVDMRSLHERERKTVESLGMKYVSISWQCFHPSDGVIARFLQLIHDNPGKKIFIHCHIGDDRVGLEIAAYRMANEGWTAEEAKKEMIAFGQNRFHRMICWQTLRYEKEFPERYRTKPAFAALRENKTSSQPAS